MDNGQVRAVASMPDEWPPTSYAPYVALRSMARWVVSLDEPSMVEARRSTSLADVINRFRDVLAFDARVREQVAAKRAAGTGESS